MLADRLGVQILGLSTRVTGEVDVRGTLAVEASVPIGFQQFHCRLELRVPEGTDPALIQRLLAGAEEAASSYRQFATVRRFTYIQMLLRDKEVYMFRLLAFFYGVVAYVVFLGVFFYTIAFLSGFLVPITVDTPSTLNVSLAVVIDLALLGLFGLQHSGMARRGFKRLWTKVVPWPIERSTYVYATCAALILLI